MEGEYCLLLPFLGLKRNFLLAEFSCSLPNAGVFTKGEKKEGTRKKVIPRLPEVWLPKRGEGGGVVQGDPVEGVAEEGDRSTEQGGRSTNAREGRKGSPSRGEHERRRRKEGRPKQRGARRIDEISISELEFNYKTESYFHEATIQGILDIEFHESVILEGGQDAEASDHPTNIISDFIEDFVTSKRNLFSRVSGWLLSETREDKIDDFILEMENNGFWLMNRRESIAQTLLKNVDLNNTFHCKMKFDRAEELSEHSSQCTFKSINCMNEGCRASFCAVHMEKHDSICPFKILPCEQKCSDSIMRREMDRHCITVCAMKLVNCPFYPVGCRSTIPQCTIERHCSDFLHSHMLYILHKEAFHNEASVEDLNQRVQQMEKSSSLGQLSKARDVRSLTFAVKDLEAKLGPLEVNIVKQTDAAIVSCTARSRHFTFLASDSCRKEKFTPSISFYSPAATTKASKQPPVATPPVASSLSTISATDLSKHQSIDLPPPAIFRFSSASPNSSIYQISISDLAAILSLLSASVVSPGELHYRRQHLHP
ncbi:hypothetical protein HHK36_030413 [Tetracentron sinense]|uniref:TRAF-type domain-containing protein n=1 Tax=Tetracentron sinense TaxID=13715 RepID=A0A834YC28_TETSI|nr:hypothetical protein HHK36_030413 [Tetracentron sinense]